MTSADPPRRRHEVGISVEALLQQWARQETGPTGAAVVLGTEVSARTRGGVEWRADDAVAVGVLARPAALDPDRVDLGWLAASLGAAAALGELRGGSPGCRWPDRIAADGIVNSGGDTGGVEVVASSVAGLGPGRVDHLGLVVRVAPAATLGPGDRLESVLIDGLRWAAVALDEPDRLLARYRDRCDTLGRVVDVRLLPHGSTRGRAVTIDEGGALVVESETGFRQAVAIPTLDSLA